MPNLTIEEMQAAIFALGWQWNEHVFNDQRKATLDANPDVYIQFNPSRSPHAFSYDYPEYRHPGRTGWGRFPRFYAWQMAYDAIVLGNRKAED